MYRLVIFFFFSVFPFNEHLPAKKEVYLILDDCINWKRSGFLDKKNMFFLYKDFDKKLFEEVFEVNFSHVWLADDKRLSSIKLKYSDLLEGLPIFSSGLSKKNWENLSKLKDTSFFILIPEDYCSEKRFLNGYEFTLYEVNLDVTASTDDVIEPLNLLPLPEVDSVRRKKKNTN
ncbi:hypothetical protein E4S40_06805 [Algoriphagus kandeliae]|uniref:Uncharacterized protein n=1 Tax=Algoriphagus kandeliae TaxID=2562278 RepID=A0A4Y9QUT3_9BACT|nr:hypothetical protein [Algoriphagus kandeliae]TFV95927.1 hypothetical protein E4S40_06805 [Algoriphagus kandeliae]